VVVRQVTTCAACQGRGQVIDETCRACDGAVLAIEGKGLPRYHGHSRAG
jgi:DnaJ-class molecular chaperone